MPNETKPDEPQYRDPETGKPIIYDDGVPDLLRGDLRLTAEEEARIPKLNTLFAEAPLTLLAMRNYFKLG